MTSPPAAPADAVKARHRRRPQAGWPCTAAAGAGSTSPIAATDWDRRPRRSQAVPQLRPRPALRSRGRPPTRCTSRRRPLSPGCCRRCSPRSSSRPRSAHPPWSGADVVAVVVTGNRVVEADGGRDAVGLQVRDDGARAVARVPGFEKDHGAVGTTNEDGGAPADVDLVHLQRARAGGAVIGGSGIVTGAGGRQCAREEEDAVHGGPGLGSLASPDRV